MLQAELAVPVFGTAADGEKVTVEFAGQKKSAVAKEGKWKIATRSAQARQAAAK